MILLTIEQFNKSDRINLNEEKYKYNYKLLDSLNLDSFFFDSLISLGLDDFKILVKDIFIKAYLVEENNNCVTIIDSIDLKDYIKDILLSIKNDKSVYVLDKIAYVYMLTKFNNNLDFIFNDYKDIILKITEESLNYSLDSVSYIAQLLKNKDVFSKEYLKEIGLLVKNNLDDLSFIAKSTIEDLIFVGDLTKSYSTLTLHKRLENLENEEKSLLPF